jgi:hypothetical protein
MLTVRKMQMELFEQVALRRFEDEMVEHLKQFSPKHCQVIGEPAVRQVIRLGVKRAAEYGLTNRGPVRFYIELMFMFGSDFDTDPQVPWAPKALNDPTLTDQMTKADRLYDQVMDYVAKVAGPDHQYAKAALRRVRQVRFEELPPPDGRFTAAMLAKLKEIHPEKVAYLGQARAAELIARGRPLAEKFSLAPEHGAGLCVSAIFAMGHGFGSDPLLPWVSKTIKDPVITDSGVRAARLYSRMMTYLGGVLANQDAETK